MEDHSAVSPPSELPRCIGRYVLFHEIGRGGMASVHLGRLHGPAGFKKTVAVKRLHAHHAKDPQFVTRFLDEARLSVRIQHPNVVPTLDVVTADGELFLVMDYVHGEALSRLLRTAPERGVVVPVGVAAQIITNVAFGIHAAHEARSDRGTPLHIVHRDLTPQNVIVDVDGVARVLDFGIAHATERYHHTTGEGAVWGKIAYMAPEQLNGAEIDRRVDIYAMGAVLWELLTGEPLFTQTDLGKLVTQIVAGNVEPPSSRAPSVPPELDAIVLKALHRNKAERFQTAEEMALAIERVIPPVGPRAVGRWVKLIAGEALREREIAVFEMESQGGAPSSRAETATPAGAAVASAMGVAANANTHDAALGRTAKRRPHAAWKRRPTLLLGAATLLAVAFAAGVWRDSVRQARMPESVAWAVAASDAPVPSPTQDEPASCAPTAPPAVVALAPTPPAAPVVKSARPQATFAVERSKGARNSRAARPKVTSTPAPEQPRARENCNPPWVVDSSGVRTLKPECM